MAYSAYLRLRVPMQHFRRDIGPEFTEGIRQRVPSQSEGIFLGDFPCSPVLARIVSCRDCLCYTPSEDFRGVKSIVPMIVRSDEDPRCGICATFHKPTVPHRKIAGVLMKNSGQRKNNQVVPIRLIDKATPVILPVAANTFSQRRMRVRCLGEQRSNSHEHE